MAAIAKKSRISSNKEKKPKDDMVSVDSSSESSLNCPDLIKQYRGNKKSSQKRTASSSLSNETEVNVFDVEYIVDHKYERGKTFFLIKWKGWKESQNTWEPQSSLSCPAILKKYLESSKIATKLQGKYTESEDDVMEQSFSSNGKLKKTQAAAAEVDPESEDDSDEQEEDYEVEDIVNHKTVNGKRSYQVKWKGWSNRYNTWKPESSLSCEALLKKYVESSKVQKTTKKPADLELEKSSKNKKERMAKKSLKTMPKDWEVDKIMGVKYNDDDSKDFLIRWKGCDASQNTWELENNVDCPALISEFISKLNGNDAVSKKRRL